MECKFIEKGLLVVDLFKIDKIKKEMIILKEPFKKNTVLKIDDEKMNDIMIRYKYFKYKEDDKEAVFAQDLADESNMSYHIRRKYSQEYACHY